MREVSLGEDKNIFHINLESYNTIDPSISKNKFIRSLTESNVSTNALLPKSQKPAYQKVTVLSIMSQLKTNSLLYFSISKVKPTVTKNFLYGVSHTGLWLNCHTLMVSKKTKKQSQITDTFITKIKNIYETPVFPCPKMCAITKELIISELNQLTTEFVTILEDYGVENFSQEIKPLLRNLLKQKLITTSINHAAVRGIVNSLNNISNEIFKQSANAISAILTNSIKISNDLNLKLTKTSQRSYTLQEMIGQVQMFLSKIHSINTALLFVDYLQENCIEFFYYSVYCDFRGRVYYKSRCSPQNYWYYRFLYHLGSINDYSAVKNTSLIPLS